MAEIDGAEHVEPGEVVLFGESVLMTEQVAIAAFVAGYCESEHCWCSQVSVTSARAR